MNWQAFKSSGLESQIKTVCVVLALLSLLLCLWCVYKVWLTPVPGPVLPAADSLRPLVVQDPAAVAKPGIIAVRPLFWRGRKAFLAAAPKKAEAAEPKGDLDKLEVVGVYAAGVLIKGLKGQNRIAIGERVYGWTLKSVEDKTATFNRNGRNKQLLLGAPEVSAKIRISNAGVAGSDPEA